jgi:DNA-binding MarR family transcriptional regulator
VAEARDVAEVLDEVSRYVIRQTAALGGMSLTAASTLARLVDRGPLRLTELATAQGVSQPSMTVMVSRLEKQGLVVRRSDPADRRIVLVEITAAGRDGVGKRRRIRRAFLAGLVGELGPADRAALAAAGPALHKLIDPAALPAAVEAAAREERAAGELSVSE